jgi:hypothetical protein
MLVLAQQHAHPPHEALARRLVPRTRQLDEYRHKSRGAERGHQPVARETERVRYRHHHEHEMERLSRYLAPE